MIYKTYKNKYGDYIHIKNIRIVKTEEKVVLRWDEVFDCPSDLKGYHHESDFSTGVIPVELQNIDLSDIPVIDYTIPEEPIVEDVELIE